jgi:hypothetical protein
MRKRLPIAIAILVLCAGGLAWWQLRGDGAGPAKPAEPDPWASTALDESAIVAEMRAAHGDAPADTRPASASGRVTRAADGTGVAGAVVALHPADAGIPELGVVADERMITVTADATGAWTAPAVPPGTYVVTAAAPDLLPGTLDGISLVAGAAKTGLDLALTAGGATVSGTVTDIGGGPIAEAQVRATHDDVAMLKGKVGGFVAITGADGTYRLTLPDGEWDAEVTQPDYTPARRGFELAGRALTLDFKLTPGASIRGRVLARADRKPVPGAIVRASRGRTGSRRGNDPDGGVGIGGITAVADADGAFTLRGLGSGAITVHASARGFASAAPTTVALGIGESVDGVEVLVDRAYTISGFVVKKGDERKGIPGIQVGAFSLGAMAAVVAPHPSGADGYFEILGVQPASYLLFALGKDVMPDVGKPVTVTDADVTNVLIVMDVGATLRGRIEPAAVAALSLEVNPDKIGLGNMFDVMKAVMVSGESDAAGNFEVRNAPPGDYTLIARTRDGRSGRLPVTIEAADQSGLVVKLEDKGAVSGRVVDAGGAPVPFVRVRAEPLERDGVKFRMQEDAQGVTGGDGAFLLRGLDPGTYGLTVTDDQGTLAWADAAKARDAAAMAKPYEVTVTGSGETSGVTLTVEPRDGVIRGLVLGVDGKPAADAWVTATYEPIPRTPGEDEERITVTVGTSGGDVESDADAGEEELGGWGGVGPQDPVLTGADGRFVVPRLRRGSYQLIAEGATGAERARRVGVKTGDTVTLQLETLGSITGVVTAAGAPVTDYSISCKGPAGAELQRVRAADGAYRFERRPPGKYTCTVTSELGPASGAVTVKGAEVRLDLTIGTWGAILGTVVNVMTGAPMPGLKLAAMNQGGSPEGFQELLTGGGPTTDAAGRFEVGKQPAGKTNLLIIDGGLTGFHIVATREVELGPGERKDLGTIKALAPRVGPAGTLGLTAESRSDKLVVLTVAAGGPAATAGVKAGDTITAIDGHAVAELTLDLARDALDTEHVAAGQVVTLSLARATGTPATLDAAITAAAVPTP